MVVWVFGRKILLLGIETLASAVESAGMPRSVLEKSEEWRGLHKSQPTG